MTSTFDLETLFFEVFEHILELPNYKLNAFCQKISQYVLTLQMLTSMFEEIMIEVETFYEFYAKLNGIVYSTFNLGETINEPKIVIKIHCALLKHPT